MLYCQTLPSERNITKRKEYGESGMFRFRLSLRVINHVIIQVVCAVGPLDSPRRSGGERQDDDGLARIINQGIPIL